MKTRTTTIVLAAVFVFILAFVFARPFLRKTAQTVVPWTTRAERHLSSGLFAGQSGQNLANAIQNITHPSGKEPKLAGVKILHVGDALNVRIDVTWKGGLIGTEYTTVVVWEFDKQKHGKASVTQDTASIAVDKANLEKLDEYFRTECYAKLHSNLGDERIDASMFIVNRKW